MKKTRKKMILSATVLTALALFAGCTRANAASPDPTAARTITLEEAKAIAYTHAGVSESDARDKSYERDDGIYEIDFEHGGFEYDYDISRQGEILKVEKEPEPTEKPAQTQPAETAPAVKTITLEEAKAIAYAHAGVSESDALDKSYERDDGIYEIDFEHGGFEYDYDISRQGEILKVEKEPEPTAKSAESKPAETKPAQTKSDRISAEKALSIALDHAGVTNARDRDVEWDDGRWEVSFESGRTEYEYDISADGTILRWEKEIDD